MTLSGTFRVPGEAEQLTGRLVLDGEESVLEAVGKGRVAPVEPADTILGRLTDHKAVSLINCLVTESGGSRLTEGEETFRVKYFPHYVARGEVHLSRDERVVRSARYEFAAARTLFYDRTSFGSILMDNDKFNTFIANYGEEHHLKRVRAEEPDGWPTVRFFSGKTKIARFETAWGDVQVNQAPSKGDAIVWIQVSFRQPLKLEEALDHVFDVQQLLELLIGQRQVLEAIQVNVGSDDEKGRQLLDLYGTMHGRRTHTIDRDRPPRGFDTLIDAARDTAQFERVAPVWLERQKQLRDSRIRFASAFYADIYGHDRLIGAANAFDILPEGFWPSHETLTEAEVKAIAASRDLFKKLEDGPIRSRALQSLGHLKASNLASKIKHRAAIVTRARPQKFAELDFVCQHAARCRNYYVHGGKPAFDYQNNFDLFHFLIDTLEFVFAASDLIECGWDFEGFCAKGTTMSHPFGAYLVNYAYGLESLKSKVEKLKDGGSSD